MTIVLKYVYFLHQLFYFKQVHVFHNIARLWKSFTLGSCSSWSRLLWEPFLCLEASVSTADSSPETPELPSHERPPDRFTPAAHRSCAGDIRRNNIDWDFINVFHIFLTYRTTEVWQQNCWFQLSFFTFIEASFCSSGLRHTGTGRFILFSVWPPLAT